MTERSTQLTKTRWWTWALQALAHLTGVLAVLSVNALLFVNEHAMEAFYSGLGHAAFFDLVTVPLLLQAGLAACFWALIVITFTWGRLTLVERRATKKLVMQRSRGTILTETLIIFPIFLLFTSGLAQLWHPLHPARLSRGVDDPWRCGSAVLDQG